MLRVKSPVRETRVSTHRYFHQTSSRHIPESLTVRHRACSAYHDHRALISVAGAPIVAYLLSSPGIPKAADEPAPRAAILHHGKRGLSSSGNRQPPQPGDRLAYHLPLIKLCHRSGWYQNSHARESYPQNEYARFQAFLCGSREVRPHLSV